MYSLDEFCIALLSSEYSEWIPKVSGVDVDKSTCVFFFSVRSVIPARPNAKSDRQSNVEVLEAIQSKYPIVM